MRMHVLAFLTGGPPTADRRPLWATDTRGDHRMTAVDLG